jgi:hypothetical protein
MALQMAMGIPSMASKIGKKWKKNSNIGLLRSWSEAMDVRRAEDANPDIIISISFL